MKQMYLIRKKGSKQKAHLWNGTDTECAMWSTCGIKKENYILSSERLGKDLCHMCAVVKQKSNGRVK